MKKWWIAAVVASSVIGGVVLFVLMNQSTSAVLKIGDGEFTMRVARTERDREEGLSGTTGIGANEALVFVFPTSERWGIWMKDMKYPIDIVWLDEQKTVMHIEQHVKPESYPAKTFQPDDPAKYVIELKAGVVGSQRITIGSQAVFDSTKGSFE